MLFHLPSWMGHCWAADGNGADHTLGPRLPDEGVMADARVPRVMMLDGGRARHDDSSSRHQRRDFRNAGQSDRARGASFERGPGSGR